MAGGWIHTVYKAGSWVNEIEDGPIFSKHASREEAIDAGRNLAWGQRTEHVVHDADGSIAERHPYDPGLLPSTRVW